MDFKKRERLIQSLRSQREPWFVNLQTFFDGNSDPWSIGCNLIDHPGIDEFRTVLERIAARPDVEHLYVRISELEPDPDLWPFSDNVVVIGTIPVAELRRELATLSPSEVGLDGIGDLPKSLLTSGNPRVLAAWWD